MAKHFQQDANQFVQGILQLFRKNHHFGKKFVYQHVNPDEKIAPVKKALFSLCKVSFLFSPAIIFNLEVLNLPEYFPDFIAATFIDLFNFLDTHDIESAIKMIVSAGTVVPDDIIRTLFLEEKSEPKS